MSHNRVVHVCEHGSPWRPEEAVRYPGAEVTEGYEPPETYVGTESSSGITAGALNHRAIFPTLWIFPVEHDNLENHINSVT